MSTTNPDYYKNNKGKDLIAEMTERYSKEAFIGFCRGNIEKYVRRFDGKNGIEDLEKAKVYIDRLIEGLEYFDKKKFSNETINVAIEPNFDFDWQRMSIDDLVDKSKQEQLLDGELSDEKDAVQVALDRLNVYGKLENAIKDVFKGATPYEDVEYFVDLFMSYVDYIEQENKPMYQYLADTINPNNSTFEMAKLFLMFKTDPDMGQISTLEYEANNIMEYVSEFIYEMYCEDANSSEVVCSVLSLLDIDINEIKDVSPIYVADAAAGAYHGQETMVEAIEKAVEHWRK